ncbi:MAG: OmpA family protein [Bacteroidota bacterium]
MAFVCCLGQVTSAQEKPIILKNPSFGDIPRVGGDRGLPIKGWHNCGFSGETPPDIQPNLNKFDDRGFFGVTTKAYHDSTYLGMVVRDNDTYEAVGQRLRRPLEKGKCYEFSLHACRSKTYESPSRTQDSLLVNYDKPVIIRIWGGSGYCGTRELLAETEPVKNTLWKRYRMRFEPTERHSYIMIQAYYKVPSVFAYNGNVLVDNLSEIVPVPCDGEVPAEEPEEVLASVNDFPVESKINQKPSQQSSPQTEGKTEVPESYSTVATPEPVEEVKTQKERTLQGYEHRKLRRGQTIQINRLYFEVDDSTINTTSFLVLDEIYEFMDEHQGLRVEIRGHTNGNCDTAFCDKLSLARARAVANYLIEKGIDRSRLKYKGYGKRKPIASNRYAAGRKKNRRVEVKILSLDG